MTQECHICSRGQSQTTFWALLKESSKLLGYLVIMDKGTKNMCQSPVIPVIWLLVTYLICKTGPIAHATPLSLVIWLFGYWWQLICKTGPCISSVTGYLVIWLLTFYYLVFLRPWRLRGPRGESFARVVFKVICQTFELTVGFVTLGTLERLLFSVGNLMFL